MAQGSISCDITFLSSLFAPSKAHSPDSIFLYAWSLSSQKALTSASAHSSLSMYIGLPLCWKAALRKTTPHYIYTYLFTVNSVSWHSRFDSHHMTVTWWSHTVYVRKYVRACLSHYGGRTITWLSHCGYMISMQHLGHDFTQVDEIYQQHLQALVSQANRLRQHLLDIARRAKKVVSCMFMAGLSVWLCDCVCVCVCVCVIHLSINCASSRTKQWNEF